MFLLVLLGMAGTLTATAQTPEPSGQWKFDNQNDLMAATVGNVKLSPTLVSSPGIADATVSEAGIIVANGFDGSAAIFVPATAGLKVTREEGAAASTNFSFMLDLMVPNSYPYNGLFQTNLSNGNDADLFIAKGQIGAGAMGGYVSSIWGGFWYRVVFTNSEGSLKLYVNGDKALEYATSETRWEIDPTFYLLADEDGEKQDTYLSQVAFWETPLTDTEVKELGGVDNRWVKDLSKIKDGDQFFILSDRAKFAGNTSGKAKAMSTAQSSYTVNWGDQYVYWGDLDPEAEGYVWTAEKFGDQLAFLNKEKGQYLGNMNEGENDIIFSDTPVGYTLTDLTEGAGRFFMTSDDSEHSPHVQGYLMGSRPNNSLAKQNVGDDDYSEDAATCGYPGRWRLLKLNADTPDPIDTRTKIGTAEEFAAFAQAVADGQTDIEAVLTADIVLTGNVMVDPYAGTFDGDGHKITYNYTEVDSHCGLFKTLNDGAIIRNLYIEGSAVVKGIHFGALAGDMYGTVLIENVVTNVNITGDRAGVTGDGGMAGYVDGNLTFNNCATLGKMGADGTSMYCGFVAFATDNSVSILNNCFTTCELTEGTATSYCFTFCRGAATYNNCYYLNAIGKEDGGTQITEELLASGELCFKLNGDQSTIGWYQTLGTDALPVPFATSAQVYANGELKCDGTSAGGSLVYSNSETSVIPPHSYADGWCSVCGKFDADFLSADSEGFYNIGTASELAWIAEFIAQGNTSVNIRLTADINLSTSSTPDLMIASSATPFSGIFDGQEHEITVNYENVTSTHQGFFRTVKDATIRNLYLRGDALAKAIHFGALMGRADGTVLVENVVTEVNITGQMSQVTGDAGMVGANYAQLTFNNCATWGSLGYPGSSMYSSFVGWAHAESSTTLNNCYTMCELTEGTGTGSCFTLTFNNGTVTLNDSYYIHAFGTVQGTQFTGDTTLGEFCYKLNGDQSEIHWYQSLGMDGLPVPFASHGQVYANGTLRCDGAELPDAPVIYSNTEGQTVKPDHQYGADGTCTVCGSPSQNADGYYLIDTSKKYIWFATKVNAGETTLNALLTADIDLTTSDNPDIMIGNSTNMFGGTFDGGGHSITYNYTISTNYCGLFSYAKNATIRNLIVKGDAVVTAIHYGALIGRAEGIVLVENVITDVNITGQKSGVTGDGGMLGALYANITFNNCATLGKLGYEGSSMYSGFSGYSSSSSSATLNNCYTISQLTEGTGTGSCYTFIHGSGAKVFNNCYYLNLIGKEQGTAVTAEEVANGSLAAKLGAGWYQNIGEDAYPVFDKTHNTVKEITEAGYATMYIPDAVEIPTGVEVFTGEFDEEWLKLNAVTGSVPAWEPVVLKGAPGFYGFKPAAGTEKTTEVVFADLNLTDTEVIPETKVEGLTFSFASGTNTNAPKYYANGSAARIYASNSMTISASAPITKIEFTFNGNNYALASNGFEVSDGEYALATKTWTGSAESITFTNTSTKQWRITSMKVTYTSSPDNIAGNVLKGTAEDIEAAGKYVLAQPAGESVGFYKAATGTIKAGKAYLESGTDVKAFYFAEDDVTGIESLNTQSTLNTQNTPIYNLAGQRIQKMQRGINIVNGKKILK